MLQWATRLNRTCDRSGRPAKPDIGHGLPVQSHTTSGALQQGQHEAGGMCKEEEPTGGARRCAPNAACCGLGGQMRNRLSVCRVRGDQRGGWILLRQTWGCGSFLPSDGGGYYRVARGAGRVPNETQFPCQARVACPAQNREWRWERPPETRALDKGCGRRSGGAEEGKSVRNTQYTPPPRPPPAAP